MRQNQGNLSGMNNHLRPRSRFCPNCQNRPLGFALRIGRATAIQEAKRETGRDYQQ